MRTIAAIFTFTLMMASLSAVSQSNNNDKLVDSLLSEMTLEEKIGQLTLFTSDWTTTGPTLKEDYEEDVKAGRCGNIFNAHTVAYTRKLQDIAVKKSRLGIPLLFGYDVIHGYKTMFPIPLGEACSWDLRLMEESARLASEEAAAGGLNWTFNPMIDISYDPRWGRVAEGAGEDPYYASLVARAKVRGHQQNDLSSPHTLAACMKHFAGYGAAEAGRDYNTVNMSERRLREIYLPPFRAATEEGVATVMTAFNELNGIPATANPFLLKDILRDEWDFGGMVVTDYTSINELVPHGFAKDEKHAGELALNAGVDMDMQGAVYYNHLKKSVKEGKVAIEDINQAVKNVLNLKADLGLFEDPYRYLDEEREAATILSEEHQAHALEAGKKSIVLLKNDPFEGSKLLPLSETEGKTIALIGPLGDNKEDMTGTWWASADIPSIVTIREGLQKRYPNATINTVQGCDTEGSDRSGFEEAVAAAKEADIVVMAIGENKLQSGEAASRTDIQLPGEQKALLKKLHKTGKPIISIVLAGRPLGITWMEENIPAILYAWHPGTKAGEAIAAVMSGDYNPSAKLVTTFPRNVGQIPLYYNSKKTGRPFEADNKYTSKYLYTPNEPLYPFGYGLSYTDFEYSDVELDSKTLVADGAINAQMTVTNVGEIAGSEVVQFYVRDLVASVTRPVKELKGFEKIFLEPGESRTVNFTITPEMLRFYNQEMIFTAEEGDFKVFIGRSSADTKEASFEYVAE